MNSNLHGFAHPTNLHMLVPPQSILVFQKIVLPCTTIVTLELTLLESLWLSQRGHHIGNDIEVKLGLSAG
jgi:hypothetical protein